MTPDQERARVLAAFQAAGAELVDLPILQRAETLLDLYGENIRGRAYTTRDPVAGDLMLRPDFTVPVVQMHLNRGTDAARYAYAGKVFRMQDPSSDRPSEYEQVGFEVFGSTDPAAAEAEVFTLFARTLAFLPVHVATGDIGILRAAIQALPTSDQRKSALLRHLWRPGRFRKLLDWFSGRTHRMLRQVQSASPLIGLRSQSEIDARLAALSADQDEAPIPPDEAARIDAILAMKEKLPTALDQLTKLMGDVPSIRRMAARIEALSARGVDVASLDFEGAYGRTNMEYYDGFVFGFYAAQAPMPPVATGGRYDALTTLLGRDVPAVGGMIRPDLAVELAP